MLLQLESFLLILFKRLEPVRNLALAFAGDVGVDPLKERLELRSLHIVDVFDVRKVAHLIISCQIFKFYQYNER